MPVRISRSALTGARGPSNTAQTKQKNSTKRKRRTLDAYSIAAKQEPERLSIQRHRLGEAEADDTAPRRKRVRTEHREDDGDEDASSGEVVGITGSHGSKNSRVRSEEGDVEEGSDSEGNEWRMGGLGSQDEDSDIDSEEAFGESDEERFEGFMFRGSSNGIKASGKLNGSGTRGEKGFIDLDEEDGIASGEEVGFGDEGVDLADMLDDDSDENDNTLIESDTRNAAKRFRNHVSSGQISKSDLLNGIEFEDGVHSFEATSDEPSEESDIIGSGIWDSEKEDSEDDESVSNVSEEESDENNPEKLEKLQDIVSSLSRHQNEVKESSEADSRSEAQQMLRALQGMSGLDPALSLSAKKLTENLKPAKSRKSDLVHVPLPKRQQDALNRTAAYQAAKETLGRWTDTVKHNRRAEHLVFPLKDPEAQKAKGTSHFVSNEVMRPQNDLEKTIQTILEESGLANKGGKAEEENIRKMEELQSRNLPIEEVLARRAELRKQRDLLFREEIRARRIKKIKSKAYRRVHRRERARDFLKHKNLLAEAGIETLEDEKEANDRRRAEERMGARHRESRWAKNMKRIGRTVWDEDARSGVIEMAQKSEQLMHRVQGKGERSDEDSSDEDSESTPLDLQNLLRDVENEANLRPLSSLHSMKFMQRAEANQKRLNDETIEQIQKDLAEEDDENEAGSASEEGESFLGRKTFGPNTSTKKQSTPNKSLHSEFEEAEEADGTDEDQESGEFLLNPAAISSQSIEKEQLSSPRNQQGEKPKLPFQGAPRIFGNKPQGPSAVYSDAENESATDRIKNGLAPIEKNAPADTNGWATVQYPREHNDEAPSQEDADAEMPIIPSNAELIRAAFGGDDVEANFEKEKKALVVDEDDKITDNALPGWGSWVGEGIGKRELNRNKGKFLTKVQGIKPQNRKDARLEKTIISERRVKKNAKYLASTLPHPFESRQQYERALRIPIGPEWTTKETYQKATKPRVIVKQGIITPMERPLL